MRTNYSCKLEVFFMIKKLQEKKGKVVSADKRLLHAGCDQLITSTGTRSSMLLNNLQSVRTPCLRHNFHFTFILHLQTFFFLVISSMIKSLLVIAMLCEKRAISLCHWSPFASTFICYFLGPWWEADKFDSSMRPYSYELLSYIPCNHLLGAMWKGKWPNGSKFNITLDLSTTFSLLLCVSHAFLTHGTRAAISAVGSIQWRQEERERERLRMK